MFKSLLGENSGQVVILCSPLVGLGFLQISRAVEWNPITRAVWHTFTYVLAALQLVVCGLKTWNSNAYNQLN